MRILSLGIKENIDFGLINRDVIRQDIYLNKPSSGVLWGSTLHKIPGDLITSSWNWFVDGIMRSKDFDYGVSFTLHKKSKIMTIDSLDDYITYMKKYKILDDIGRGMNHYGLDFKQISKDFDAFHLTERAFLDLRMPMDRTFYELGYRDFYAYDAESWIIFNPDCINKGSILNHGNVFKENRDNY